MFKVGPTWVTRGADWDHQGKSEIAQIFVSHGGAINFIQFLYVKNENQLVLSEKIGGNCGQFFDTVTLNYPAEFIAWISGHYYYSNDLKILTSITFGTNKGTYGPFGEPAGEDDHFVFKYQMGSGFYGTSLDSCVESIGIYVKPMSKLSDSNEISGADDDEVKPAS